jgi:hypothetical protein
MKKFEIILNNFTNVLQKYNPINYDYLQSPLPDKMIAEYLNTIGVKDEDVFSLYKWKNGVPDDFYNSMIFEFECTMLSLQEVKKCIEVYKVPSPTQEGLIPLFSCGNDEYLLFNNNAGADYGKIYLFSVSILSIDPVYAYYDSLQSMFETTVQLYEVGGLHYDDKTNFLGSNIDISVNIYKQLNPISNFYETKD